MSRELFAFLLSELKTIRILCRGQNNGWPCSGAIELDVSELAILSKRLTACPLCGNSFGVFPDNCGGVAVDGFAPLFNAIKDLKAVAAHFEIEFVLPKKPQS